MWLYIDKSKPFTSIVAGFAIHSLAILFRNITGADFIYAIVCMYGWYFILSGFIRIRKHLKLGADNLYWKLLVLYVFICLIMIIRGYTIDYRYIWNNWMGAINYHLFNPTYILPFFMPVIALIPPRDIDFSCLVKWSMTFSVISILALVIFGRDMIAASMLKVIGLDAGEDADKYRFYGQIYTNVVLIAFCYKYVTKKVWRWNTVGLISALLINVICARRGISATLALLLMIDAYFYIKSFRGKKQFIKKTLVYVMVGCAVALFIYGSSFAYIKARGLEDNRSHVDVALMSQMSPLEKWIGKGLNGRYYYKLNIQDDYLNGWRYLSETGYYYLVLRGGYILTWLYILIILMPALKGILKSKNTLCKALGAIMIVSLLQLYPFGHLTFNIYYFVIWTGVRLCTSRSVLKASDEEIQSRFFPLK